MTIVLSDCVKGLSMGLIGMQVESCDNVVVVETVANNVDEVSNHSISDVIHVTNVVRWVRHSRNIDTI